MTARDPRSRDCLVPGCDRAEYRGGICRRHWLTIPLNERIRSAGAIMKAQRVATRAEHERLAQLIDVRQEAG